jgi:hypothetical protein
MTTDRPDYAALEASLAGATRVVVETDHVYREVGQVVALDIQRIEFSPDVWLAMTARLAAAEAALYHVVTRRHEYDGGCESCLAAYAIVRAEVTK